MSTFKCSECGCAESTGTSNGQLDQIKKMPKLLCSECDPRIGKWHNRFPKEPMLIPYDRNIHGQLHPNYHWND